MNCLLQKPAPASLMLLLCDVCWGTCVCVRHCGDYGYSRRYLYGEATIMLQDLTPGDYSVTLVYRKTVAYILLRLAAGDQGRVWYYGKKDCCCAQLERVQK